MIHINCYLFFFQEQSSLRKGLMKDCRVRCEIRFASSLCLFVIILFVSLTTSKHKNWKRVGISIGLATTLAKFLPNQFFFLAQGVCGVFFAASLIGQILFLVVGP